MDSVNDIMQLCRLCLVRDEVNIPIFEEEGDIRQIFLKISACLPVKVSREDNLPKSICDGCSSKLEALYQFWNTSANSEKKLIKWLSQGGGGGDRSLQHSMSVDPVVLKQEVVEVPDDRSSPDNLVSDDLNVSNDEQDYLQQQLPYQNVEFQFQQDDFEVEEEETGTRVEVEPEAPSRKRRAAAIRALASMGSEDEGNHDLLEPKIAKTEEESEESGNEDAESSTFVSLPPATDNEQPGPSGVGKTSADAPIRVKEEPVPSRNDASLGRGTAKGYKTWNCKKCSETFDTSRKLRDHRKQHRKDDNDAQYNYRYDADKEAYVCFTCDVECDTKERIESHVLEHEDKFACDVCGETFVKPYEYSTHLFGHDQSKGFGCPFCKYTTPRRTAIMIHINTYHLRKYIYTCNLCGKGFNDCVLYKEHHNVHQGIKPFRCVVCDKEFAFSSYLTSHQVRSHQVNIDGMIGTNQCCVCSKRFTRKNSLEKHMQKHVVVGDKKVFEKKHLCDICGKGFSRTEKLRIHYRVHTGVKPYACSYCDKCFTKRDYMIMHERVHSGEKPYSCEYCGKCFNQGAPLRLHIRSHTGERPYLCHICNSGFISRGVLNLHLRSCPGRSE